VNSNMIGLWIVRILFISFYIAIPVLNIINISSKILLKSKIIKKAGKNIYLSRKSKVLGVKLNVIILIFGILFILFRNYLLGILIIIQGLFLTLNAIAYNKYLNYHGVYENGLVLNDYLPWKEVHSWKLLNSSTIVFLLNNGSAVDYKEIQNIDSIKDILEIKNIKYLD